MTVSSKVFGIYLGNRIEIYLTDEQDLKHKMKLDGNRILFQVDDIEMFLSAKDHVEAINEAYHAFLFRQTKLLVDASIKHAQQHFKMKPKKIVIERSIKKWGSCNQDRILTFNYLLATKHKALIDYVVIHEMCHMFHLNHDRSFWRLLGSILPNYKSLDAELNQHR